MLLKHGKIKNISGLLMAVMFLFLPAKLNAEPSDKVNIKEGLYTEFRTEIRF